MNEPQKGIVMDAKGLERLSEMAKDAPPGCIIYNNYLRAARDFFRSAEYAEIVRYAERYRKVRRGQHWDVVDFKGDSLRAEILDAAVDAAIAKEPK